MTPNSQLTVATCVSFEGIGVHTGKLNYIKIHPADENTGIIFVKNRSEIKATIKNVVSTISSTTIGKDGETISTIEHLMAAFYGLGIDNAIITVKGSEIPILDGSSRIFFEKMLKAGLKTLDDGKFVAELTEYVEFNDSDRTMLGKPYRELKIEYSIDYPAVGLKESMRYVHTMENFREIMDARTFVIKQRYTDLRGLNLGKGVVPDKNTIIIDNEVIKNRAIRENCIKHKVLDCVGDLYLIGSPLHADIYCQKGGHGIHIGFLRKVLEAGALKFYKI